MKRRDSLVLVLVLLAASAVGAALFVKRPGHSPARGPAPIDAPGDAHEQALAGPAAPESSPLAKAPSAEPLGSREAPTGDPICEWHLLDPEGLGLGDVRVLMIRGQELVHDEFTDGEGVVRVAADGQEVEAVVLPRFRPAQSTHLVLLPGIQSYRLSPGSRLAGRVVDEAGSGLAHFGLRVEADWAFPQSEAVPALAWALADLGHRLDQLRGETGTDGSFEFEGLPSDWRGEVELPSGWQIVEASEGQVAAYARSLHFLRPCTQILLRVTQQVSLSGRFVRSDSGEPLGKLAFWAELRTPDSERAQLTSLRTGPDGAFLFSSRERRILGLTLKLGSQLDEAQTILSLGEADLPADGDLGDIALEAGREIRFHLQDPRGVALRNGRAEAGPARSAPTAGDGDGVLAWVPAAVRSMRVEATGYVPLEVELPEGLRDRLVVELQPANSLEVVLLPPQGASPDSFRVLLQREDGLCLAPIESSTEQRAQVTVWAYPPADMAGRPLNSFLHAAPDNLDAGRGSFHFRGLRAGVPIQLEVRGITGPMVYYSELLAPLGPGEERDMTIALADDLLRFRGRLLDSEGHPLARATVQLGSQILGWTAKDGSFLCLLKDPQPGTLVLQHATCSTLFLHDYVVPTDAAPVEFVLTLAQKVTIEVVDERDRPIPQAEVWIQQEGFTTNTHRIEGNRHIASSLTDKDFEIVVKLAGWSYVQAHSSLIPEARVVVPVQGSLLVTIAAAATRPVGNYELVLQPDPESGAEVVLRRVAASSSTIELPMLHPGVYTARLTYEAGEAAAAGAPADSLPALAELTILPDQRAEWRAEL